MKDRTGWDSREKKKEGKRNPLKHHHLDYTGTCKQVLSRVKAQIPSVVTHSSDIKLPCAAEEVTLAASSSVK